MTKYEELTAKKSALEALVPEIEADNEEAIAQGTELKSEIETLEAEIKADEEKAAVLDMVGKDSNMEEVKMNEMELFVKSASEVDRSVKGWSVGTHIKAATDVVTSPQIADIDRSVAPQPKRVSAASLFSNATISGNAITYFLQGAYEGTPAVTAQGAKKPQNSTSFDPTTLALSKIAAFIKETDEIVSDAPFLASEVQNSLLYHLGVVEDATVIGAIAGTSGVLSTTYDGTNVTFPDAILAAIMEIKSKSAYDASVVILNPADLVTLLTTKDLNGQYIGGGFFNGAYGNGQFALAASIWGVQIFTSSTITQGEALVAAREAVKVWRKGGVDVKLYEQNEDDAIYNRVTLLAEERLATAVVDLNGVCTVAAE